MNDKNDRRNQRTRQALGDAFVELLMEKGYDAISIKDVIERANVGRSTFYSHYADKVELFVRQLDRLMELLSQHVPQAHVERGTRSFPATACFHISSSIKTLSEPDLGFRR